ncbi:MAG: methionyl-tRNA formyltransferase [Hyphomicrobiales bacterium]|nr:methionyl-tRNA formyltransferase [Hyphomicrobiales bacterium]
MPSLRLIFMGTPDFAVSVLSELLVEGYDIAAVYTQPPRKAGRGMGEKKSPVHAFADEAGIPVFTPKSLRKPKAQEQFAAHEAELAVVVAYGLILPKAVLDMPQFGCINVHASLLPRWRGAAPIQRAIMAGDIESGVMIMRMEEGLDTGPVCAAERVSIGQDMTAGELHDELCQMGAKLCARTLARLETDGLSFDPQPSKGVTYAVKITNEETRIDWNKSSADVHNHIRAMSPIPGAWFNALLGGKQERLKILRSVSVPGKGDPGTLIDNKLTVACGQNAVRLTLVQRAGKKPMTVPEFLRGFPLGKGSVFS